MIEGRYAGRGFQEFLGYGIGAEIHGDLENHLIVLDTELKEIRLVDPELVLKGADPGRVKTAHGFLPFAEFIKVDLGNTPWETMAEAMPMPLPKAHRRAARK